VLPVITISCSEDASAGWAAGSVGVAADWAAGVAAGAPAPVCCASAGAQTNIALPASSMNFGNLVNVTSRGYSLWEAESRKLEPVPQLIAC
jgi:hypothetical protein